MNQDWRARYEVALEATSAASRLALGYFEGSVQVEWKSDLTPVTIADKQTESFLRQRLSKNFPGDGFLGEEHGDQAGTSGYRWIIDPIDGTRNFVRGIPIWATLVGLEYHGDLIAGVIEVPALNITYRALRGDGAFRGSKRLHVSMVNELSQSTLFHTSTTWFVKAGARDPFLDLAGSVQTERGYGDFYGHMLVAQGSGEIMVEHGVHPWDMAAVKPIVEEAGGIFTDWKGEPTVYHPDVVATNGILHKTALERLRGFTS